MPDARVLTPLPIAIPLFGAALLASTRKWLSRAVADSLGIFFAALTLILSATLLVASAHAPIMYWMGNWYPRGSMVIGIGLLVDPVGAGLATLAALLTMLSLLFSWRFVESGANHMQPLILIFLAAMSGFCLTSDLFNLFVFFELMSIAAFALSGEKTAEPAPLQGSFNFAITNSVGGFLILTGIALLYAITGALNMAQIGLAVGQRHDPLLLFAFTLLTCGFLIKAAIFPFHLWLPDAHAVAPTPVCVLFSGLMVELGLYAVLRLRYVIFAQTFADHGIAFRAILLAFAAATVLVGGFMCYSEHHLKRVLAYSTVCHAGLMLAAMAIGGPLAAAAMLTYLLAHAFIKSGLFFTSGILLHRLRSISEHILYQRGKPLRWTPVLWFLGGAGLAAMPPFGLMLGEAAASTAADNAGIHGVEALFLFGGALTAAAVFRIGMHTFFGWGAKPITDEAAMIGELPETDPANTRIRWYHFTPPALCLVLAAAMIFVPVWLPIVRDAAARLVVQSAYLHTVYTGQPTPYTLTSWRASLPGAALRGTLATALALLLACSSVFRQQLPRRLRIGAFVERGWKPLRDMQSGHPGDYVLWLTMGVGVMGSAVMLLLRP